MTSGEPQHLSHLNQSTHARGATGSGCLKGEGHARLRNHEDERPYKTVRSTNDSSEGLPVLIVPTTDTLSEEKPTAETSILFRQPTVLQKTPAPYFVDLGLDRYVAAATEGHEFFRLATYFYSPLSDADDIIFRQSAFFLNPMTTAAFEARLG